jgi:hypothetical protein
MSEVSREEMDASILASEAEWRAQTARADCRLDVAIAQFQSELRQTAARLETQMHQLSSTLIKWMAGFALTTILCNIGMSTFMWNTVMSRPVPAQLQPVAPAPIIITIPANPAAPAPPGRTG